MTVSFVTEVTLHPTDELALEHVDAELIAAHPFEEHDPDDITVKPDNVVFDVELLLLLLLDVVLHAHG